MCLRNQRCLPTDPLCRPVLRPSSAPNTYLPPGVRCSWRIIQLMPNRSLTCSRAEAAEQVSDYAARLVSSADLPRSLPRPLTIAGHSCGI